MMGRAPCRSGIKHSVLMPGLSFPWDDSVGPESPRSQANIYEICDQSTTLSRLASRASCCQADSRQKMAVGGEGQTGEGATATFLPQAQQITPRQRTLRRMRQVTPSGLSAHLASSEPPTIQPSCESGQRIPASPTGTSVLVKKTTVARQRLWGKKHRWRPERRPATLALPRTTSARSEEDQATLRPPVAGCTPFRAAVGPTTAIASRNKETKPRLPASLP